MALVEWTQTTAEALFGDNQFYKWLKTIFAEIDHTHDSWTQVTDSGMTKGLLYVNEDLRLANYVWSGGTVGSGSSGDNGTIPDGYRPLTNISGLLGYSSNYFIRVNTSGEIRYSVPSSTLTLATSLFWHY